MTSSSRQMNSTVKMVLFRVAAKGSISIQTIVFIQMNSIQNENNKTKTKSEPTENELKSTELNNFGVCSSAHERWPYINRVSYMSYISLIKGSVIAPFLQLFCCGWFSVAVPALR